MDTKDKMSFKALLWFHLLLGLILIILEVSYNMEKENIHWLWAILLSPLLIVLAGFSAFCFNLLTFLFLYPCNWLIMTIIKIVRSDEEEESLSNLTNVTITQIILLYIVYTIVSFATETNVLMHLIDNQ